MAKPTKPSLTRKFIDTLKPKTRPYMKSDVGDKAVAGLKLQVNPRRANGTVRLSWYLKRQINKKEVTIWLADWSSACGVEEARILANIEITKLQAGGTSQAEQRRIDAKAEKMKDLAKRWVAEHFPTLEKSTSKEYQRYLDKHILPVLGEIKVKDVSKLVLADFLAPIREKAPVLANRIKAALSSMFRYADIWEMVPDGANPAKKQAQADEKSRKRFLSVEELREVGRTLRSPDVTPKIRLVIYLYLLTGMRKSELIGDRRYEIDALCWQDVDLAEGVAYPWAKGGEKRPVLLSPEVINLLNTWPKTEENPYVIPGKRKKSHLVNISDSWEEIRKITTTRSKTEAEEKNAKRYVSILDVSVHDFRRTFSTHLSSLGYPTNFSTILLGHGEKTVTEIYARVDAEALRKALNHISKYIYDLLEELSVKEEKKVPGFFQMD